MIPPNTHYVTGDELRSTMSHLQREGVYFIAGTSSIYVPKGRARYVDKSVCKPWPDLENYVRLQTPGEAARTELKREWPTLKKVGWYGDHIKLLSHSPPIFYSGPKVGEFIYIDLDAAYSQIYEKLWLDTPFPRGYFGQYPLWEPAQRLKVWKLARNSLIGVARSTSAVAYRGMKRINLRTTNAFLAPGLWATVQSILHWVMDKAIQLDAAYGNVDGYIFPLDTWSFVEEFTAWLSYQGLRWSIRATGPGEIVGWNNYQIGGTRTQLNRLGLTQKSKEFKNVTIDNGQDWERYWKGITTISGTNEHPTKK